MHSIETAISEAFAGEVGLPVGVERAEILERLRQAQGHAQRLH